LRILLKQFDKYDERGTFGDQNFSVH